MSRLGSIASSLGGDESSPKMIIKTVMANVYARRKTKFSVGGKTIRVGDASIATPVVFPTKKALLSSAGIYNRH